MSEDDSLGEYDLGGYIRAAGFDCLVCIFQEMNVGISSVFLIFVF